MVSKHYENLLKRVVKLEKIYIENVKVSNLFHVSKNKIKVLGSTPMYFAPQKKISLGWYKIVKDDNYDTAFMYKATVRPGAVILTSDEMVEELNISQSDIKEYLNMLLSNPTAREILSDEITKLAIDSGIDGIKYSDYDPYNLNSGAYSDAVLIFNPKKSIQKFSLEKYSDPYEDGDEDTDESDEFTDMKSHMLDVCMILSDSTNIDFDVSGYYSGKEACNMYILDNLTKFAPASFRGKNIEVHVLYEESAIEIFVLGVGTIKKRVDILNLDAQSFASTVKSMISSKVK